MGCCLSKNPPSKSQNSGGAPSLSPPPVEEETVKEVVLSEIPILKPPSPVVEKVNGLVKPPGNQDFKNVKSPEIQEFKVDVPTAETKSKEERVVIKPAEDIVSEVSEQSELCSFTESFSTTTTAMEKRDDGEEVNQRSPVRYRRKRPNTGDLAGGRERNMRSPARRAVPSPEKRVHVTSTRPVQGRAMTAQRRNIGPSNGIRRDTGECSARRSRSPVTRGEVGPRRNTMYKIPGLGESGKPGGRSPARIVENGGGGNKVEKQNDILVPGSREIEKQNDNALPENGESLENPLVSLECFIFL